MPSLDETIEAVSQRLLGLDPGSLAELRRMETERRWHSHLLAPCRRVGLSQDRTMQWMQIVRILPFLLPSRD